MRQNRSRHKYCFALHNFCVPYIVVSVGGARAKKCGEDAWGGGVTRWAWGYIRASPSSFLSTGTDDQSCYSSARTWRGRIPIWLTLEAVLYSTGVQIYTSLIIRYYGPITQCCLPNLMHRIFQLRWRCHATIRLQYSRLLLHPVR